MLTKESLETECEIGRERKRKRSFAETLTKEQQLKEGKK
jgi:hypothetical protein